MYLNPLSLIWLPLILFSLSLDTFVEWYSLILDLSLDP